MVIPPIDMAVKLRSMKTFDAIRILLPKSTCAGANSGLSGRAPSG